MKAVLTTLVLLFALNGCTPNPRYRAGEARPRKEKTEALDWRYHQPEPSKKQHLLTTDQMLELGGVIQSYLGRPYQGHSRFEEGLDCSRFTREVYHRFNDAELPRSAESQFATGVPVKREYLRFGDLVFYRINGREISHVGIFIGYGEFIHSSASTGVIITKMDDGYWRKRFAGARRVLS